MIELRRAVSAIHRKDLRAMLLLSLVLATLLGTISPEPLEASNGLYVVDQKPGVYRAAADDARVRAGPNPMATVGKDWSVEPGPFQSDLQALLSRNLAAHQYNLLLEEPNQAAAFPLAIRHFGASREGLTQQIEAPPETPSESEPRPSEQATSDPPEAVDSTQLRPPSPFASITTGFAYIVPASLLLQAMGAQLQSERSSGRIGMLLAAPQSPARFVVRKLAPTAVLLAGLLLALQLLLGSGWWGTLAMAVVFAALLTMTLVNGLVAASARAFAMLQLGGTTLLNILLFLPPLFASIPPVAYLSPVHVLMVSLRAETVHLGGAGTALAPLALISVGLFLFATRLATFENWTALRRDVRGAWTEATGGRSAILAGFLAVPFVLIAQLLALSMLLLASQNLLLVFLLPVSVVVEELAKFFGMKGGSWRRGAMIGFGFFLAEKLGLFLTLLGYNELEYGAQALDLLGSGAGFVLLLPLLLHVATGALQAIRRWGLVVAIAVHYLYDLAVIAWA